MSISWPYYPPTHVWPHIPIAPTTPPIQIPPRGCICPPGANQMCEAPDCPRKPRPSVTEAAP